MAGTGNMVFSLFIWANWVADTRLPSQTLVCVSVVYRRDTEHRAGKYLRSLV